VLAITVMWAVILVWYTIFGLWLVPFRIMRRGQRKQLRAELRHRELMATITERK
jgi:hypothetical protein